MVKSTRENIIGEAIRPMQNDFAVNWAFGIQGAIENIVRENFPSQLRLWPLLQTFNFEGYKIGPDHFVMVLRDKMSGIPAGSGELKPFPYDDHPPLPPTRENVLEWLSYLINRFSLRNEDAVMVLPIHDPGQSNPAIAYEMFSTYEKALWNYELQLLVDRQKSALEGTITVNTAPETPTHVTYQVSGTNNRVTINSIDNSHNVVNQTPPEILEQLLEAVRGTKADARVVAAMVGAVEDMQRNYGQDSFLNRYQTFIEVLANHFQVFGPIVAPYLPALSRLIQ